jgi:hypothetical protein
VAAFGAEGTEVIRKTNDYLNAIALTDPQRALQLAGFINEDPLLVTSLVETSKTRWLVGDGKAYIVTDLTASENSSYKVKIKPNNPTGSFPSLFGCGKTYTTYIGGSQVNYCGKYANVFTEYKDTNDMLIYLGADGFSVNGGAFRTFNMNYISSNGGENMWIFCSNIGNGNIWSGNMAYYKQEKGGIEYATLTPFIRNGENGMLDIISGTFHPNANTSGSFTIAITDKTPA